MRMIKWILGLSLCLIIFHMDMNSETYSLDSSYKTCISVADGGEQGGRQLLRFFNGCQDRLFINACVREDSGRTKLYQTSTALGPLNTWTIYSGRGISPDQVQFIAAKSNPGIPDLCVAAAPPPQDPNSNQNSNNSRARRTTTDSERHKTRDTSKQNQQQPKLTQGQGSYSTKDWMNSSNSPTRDWMNSSHSSSSGWSH